VAFALENESVLWFIFIPECSCCLLEGTKQFNNQAAKLLTATIAADVINFFFMFNV